MPVKGAVTVVGSAHDHPNSRHRGLYQVVKTISFSCMLAYQLGKLQFCQIH